MKSDGGVPKGHRDPKFNYSQTDGGKSRVTFTEDYEVPPSETSASVNQREYPKGDESNNTGTSLRHAEWKPRSETTYETMTLTRT